MNKKGFTLVEVIAVIILLSLIALLAFPPIINKIRNTKNDLSESSKKVLFSATELFVTNNVSLYPKTNGNKYCITIDMLKKNNYLPTSVYDTKGNEIEGTTKIAVSVSNSNFSYEIDDNCKTILDVPPTPPTLPPNGLDIVNSPKLVEGLIPILYDGTNWKYAKSNEKWYDYENKKWANAVILKKGVNKTTGEIINENDISLWYVWIPRFKYQIFSPNFDPNNPPIINVQFEKGLENSGTFICEDSISKTAGDVSEKCYKKDDKSKIYMPNFNDFYTHPAFSFGKKEVTGFWVNKFEISGSIGDINSKPGVSSLRNNNINNFFTAIKSVEKNYSLNGNSHMIKNMEWGAVAYLSQSKYGKGKNDILQNTANYITGGGNQNSYKNNTNQSTTQNIYGVFDMSGGSWEYTLGNKANTSGGLAAGSSGFNPFPTNEFIDRYSNNNTATNLNPGKFGDATKETAGWFNDNSDFPSGFYQWFVRGGGFNNGNESGLFFFSRDNGLASEYFSTRGSLIIE